MSASRDSSGVRPALAVRCDQAKKPMTMTAPIPIIAGAGETPRMLKGAAVFARNAPQFLRFLHVRACVINSVGAHDSCFPLQSCALSSGRRLRDKEIHAQFLREAPGNELPLD